MLCILLNVLFIATSTFPACKKGFQLLCKHLLFSVYPFFAAHATELFQEEVDQKFATMPSFTIS